MEHRRNHLGQPIGPPLDDWNPPSAPARDVMVGRYCRIEPLVRDRHAAALHEANSLDADGRLWTYLPYGPFATLADYESWMSATCTSDEPLFVAIIDTKTERAVGVASYLRIFPSSGSIEVGHVCFSPKLQRTPAATEAMVLMMKNVFDLGYRRYEWKCDALNAPSRSAAERLGFKFEGIFRNATVYKGRSRDTAWLSIIDSEWPALHAAFQKWLAPENFDAEGRQRQKLRPRDFAPPHEGG